MKVNKTAMTVLRNATVLSAAAILLAACGEEPVDVKVVSMETCLAAEDRAACETEYKEALLVHQKTSPVYASKEDCEAAHGTTTEEGKPTCEVGQEFWTDSNQNVLTSEQAQQAQASGQQVQQHSSGFSPILWYWLGTMNSGGNYGNYAPVYSNKGGGYATMNGTTFRNTGTYSATPSSVKPSTTPNRTFVNTTTARGGFTTVSRSPTFGG